MQIRYIEGANKVQITASRVQITASRVQITANRVLNEVLILTS